MESAGARAWRGNALLDNTLRSIDLHCRLRAATLFTGRLALDRYLIYIEGDLLIGLAAREEVYLLFCHAGCLGRSGERWVSSTLLLAGARLACTRAGGPVMRKRVAFPAQASRVSKQRPKLRLLLTQKVERPRDIAARTTLRVHTVQALLMMTMTQVRLHPALPLLHPPHLPLSAALFCASTAARAATAQLAPPLLPAAQQCL